MKNFATMILLLFTCANAQPTVDGIGNDGAYISLASWTQLSTGFGDHGIKQLKAYSDATHLYVMIIGEAESNFNEIYLYINGSSATDGASAATQLPAGSDGSSPFNSCRPSMDFQVDYGIRLTSGNTPSNVYCSIINYRSSGNTDTYLGGPANNGTVENVSSGSYSGMSFAYKHMGSMSSVTNEGWEMKIPLSAIGASSVTTFELLAVYGGDAFLSANTLPEIAGQSGNNLGTNPAFNVVSGNQHTTDQAMPVELTSLTATSIGYGIALSWKTATETNNHGFEVERKQSGASAWTTLGFTKGQGTTNSANNYSYVDNAASTGKYEYRLKQIDRDGKFTYSSSVEATLGLSPASVELSGNYPNPFNPSTSISFTLGSTGRASLKVFDLLGKEVATVAEGTFNAGELNTFTFNAENLTSGVYYYRLQSNSTVETRKMVLMK
jgi:hypothetical protein